MDERYQTYQHCVVVLVWMCLQEERGSDLGAIKDSCHCSEAGYNAAKLNANGIANAAAMPNIGYCNYVHT